jgi:hypothetical protein
MLTRDYPAASGGKKAVCHAPIVQADPYHPRAPLAAQVQGAGAFDQEEADPSGYVFPI